MSNKNMSRRTTLVEANGIATVSIKSPVFQKSEADQFEEMMRLLKRKALLRCIVDLSACEYISSEGLGMIARLWKYCHNQSTGRFAVVVPSAPGNEVRRLFESIGLSRILDKATYTSIEEATRFVRMARRNPQKSASPLRSQ